MREAPDAEPLAPVVSAAPVELLMPPPPPDMGARTQAAAATAGGAMARVGERTRELPAAAEQVGDARAKVQEPEAETTGRAQSALTTELVNKTAPSPAIEQLCRDIQDAIKNRRPVDEASLRRTDPGAEAQAVGSALNNEISTDGTRVAGEYAAVNATPVGTPQREAQELPDIPPAVDGPAVNAAAAAPEPIPEANLDLGPDVAATAGRVQDAGMDTEAARLVTDGPVAEARAGMTELEAAAAEDPLAVRVEQEAAIAASREGMRDTQALALAALERSRRGTVQDTLASQLALAGSEEAQRQAASERATEIFTEAKHSVNELLRTMVPTAMATWNAGKARIATAFDDELQRAKDLVDERHEGVSGTVVSWIDRRIGLPDYITDIYTRAERAFGRDICLLIREISAYVNGIVRDCEEILDNAQRNIASVYQQLPESLREWAQGEQAGFEGRLTDLREEVHAAQTDFTRDLVSQAGAAVQEARERVDALREAAKGLIQRVVEAVEAFLEDPVRAIIDGLLTLVGIAPAAFWALLARIEQVAGDIADDPVGFGNNLLAGIRLGFANFFERFFGHLLSGFVHWLFSAMGTVGVQLPPDTSLKSIVTFFLQLMGLSWTNIREILVRHIGERNVGLIEKAYDLLALLIEQGPGGIFELIKERLDPAAMVNTIIEAAVTYMTETIVQLATVRILGLFNPAGAILQAIEAIYKVLKWIFENAARIFQLVETVVNGMADIIAGNLAGMAEKTERALSGMLVPAIDFIAGFLGLGDLPEKIAEVVGGFQQLVLDAVDRAIGFLVERARGLLAGLGIGGGNDGDPDGLDGEVGEEMAFSAAGDSHRLWIDTAGAAATVMVASDPGRLESKVLDWEARAEALQDSDKKARATQLLPQVSNQLTTTRREAEEARMEFAAVQTEAPSAEAIAEARAADEEAEQAQSRLVPWLRELFELFGDTLDLSIFDADVDRMAVKAIPVAREELEAQEETYLAQDDWQAVTQLLIDAGQVNPLHRQPLGAAHSTDWQKDNYSSVFLAALDAALPTVMAAEGKTKERLLRGEQSPAYAEKRRPVIHGSLSYPEAEEGSRAAQQATLAELQRLLFRGGSTATARAHATDYFVHSLTGFSTHSDYRPQDPRPKIQGGAFLLRYDYGDEADRPGGIRTFTASLSLSLISTGMVTQYTFGRNLALKVPGTRGYTVSSGSFNAGERIPGVNLESAHIMADQFMGSGYKQALNLLLTSDHYNDPVMATAEDSIRDQVTALQRAHSDKAVTFNLRVTAFWKPIGDDPVIHHLRNILPQFTQDLSEEDTQLLIDATHAALTSKQDPKVIQLVQYRGLVYADGVAIGLVQADTNPPVDEELEKAIT